MHSNDPTSVKPRRDHVNACLSETLLRLSLVGLKEVQDDVWAVNGPVNALIASLLTAALCDNMFGDDVWHER